MSKNQTAVKWLLHQIECNNAIGVNIATNQQQEEALRIERNQIQEAFKDGVTGDSQSPTASDYYNKLYKDTDLCNT